MSFLHFLFIIFVALHHVVVAHSSPSSVLFVSEGSTETQFVSSVVGGERSAFASHDLTASVPIPPPPPRIGGHLAVFVYGDMTREELPPTLAHTYSTMDVTTVSDNSLIAESPPRSSSSVDRAEAPTYSPPFPSSPVQGITTTTKMGGMAYADSSVPPPHSEGGESPPASSCAEEEEEEEESIVNTEKPLSPPVPSIATSPFPSSSPTSTSPSSLTPSFSSASISNFIQSCIRRVAFRHLTNAEHDEVMAADTRSIEIQQTDDSDGVAAEGYEKRGGGETGRPLPVVATKKGNKKKKSEQRSSSSANVNANEMKKKGKKNTKKSFATTPTTTAPQQKTDKKSSKAPAASDGILGIGDAIISRAEDAAEYLLGDLEEEGGKGSSKSKESDAKNGAAQDSSSARNNKKGKKGATSMANDRETEENTPIGDSRDNGSSSTSRSSLRRHRLMVLLTLVGLFFLGSCVGTAIFFCVCLKLRNRWRRGKKKPNGRGYYGIDDDDDDEDYYEDDHHMYATRDGQELAALSSRGNGGAGAGASTGYGATDDRRKLPSEDKRGGGQGGGGGGGGGIITLLGNRHHSNHTHNPHPHHAHHSRTLSTNSKASSSPVAARRTPLHRHRDSLGDGGTSTLYVYRDGSNADVKEGGEGIPQGTAAIWSLSSSTSGVHNPQHIVGDTTLQYQPQIMSALPPTSSPLLGAMGSRHEIVTSPHGGAVDLGPVRGAKPRVHGGGMMLGGTYGASGLVGDEGPTPLMLDSDNSNAGGRPFSSPTAARDEQKPKYAVSPSAAAVGLSSSNVSSVQSVPVSESSKMDDSSSGVISNRTHSSAGGEGQGTSGRGVDNKGMNTNSAGGSVSKRQQFRAAKGLK